jgi:hypothetical protein
MDIIYKSEYTRFSEENGIYEGEAIVTYYRGQEINDYGEISDADDYRPRYYTPHGKGIYKWTNGNTYEGDWVKGILTGKGTFKWKSGDVYTGEFVNGELNGKGIKNYANGNVFEGDWVKGEQTGNGIYKWTNGDVYTGEFVNNELNGKGNKKLANGDVYEGDWVKGNRTGKGIFEWKSGDVYTGDFINGELSGKGIYKWASGDTYEGDWVKGIRTGKGILKWKSGYVYTGDFINGELSGKGIYKWASGDTYEGDWVKGIRTGKGIFKWKSGDVYTGEFVNGELNGKGIKNYANGNVYEGDWVKGEQTGNGIYKWTNGDVYTGEFVNNEFNGKGNKKLANGDVYEGDWVKGNRTGKGIYTHSNGDIYEGDFLNDEENGKGLLKSKIGLIYEGDFLNEIPNGNGIFKWPDGTVYIGEFLDGEFNGTGSMNWPDGNYYHGDFRDGSRTGKGILYWPNNDIYEGDFFENKRTGKGKFIWANGDWYLGFWKNKERNGFGLFYEKESDKLFSGFWIKDRFLNSELTELTKKENYIEALGLCKQVFFEASETSKLDFERLSEIKNDKTVSFETHLNTLRNKIQYFENVLINPKWNHFIENSLISEIPSSAYKDVSGQSEMIREFPGLIKIGTLNAGFFKSLNLPFYISVHNSSGLSFIVENYESKISAAKALQLIAYRLLLSIPDGKCKFFIIDQEKSGQNFSTMFGLDNRILEKEIWDDDHEIRDGLLSIKNSIPKIASELLTTKYKDLIEYNKLAKHSKQPFQFLLIANFPRGFTKESTGLLLSILKNGQKAGIYCLMSIDYSSPLPYAEFNFVEFRNVTIEYDLKENKLLNSEGCEILNKFEIEIESKLPDDIEYQKEIINGNLNKPIIFELDAISRDMMWKNSSAKGITIPIGMSDDGKQVNLQLGDGADVFHALIGGATGKGKTVLLHDLIINGAKLYHPDELQFFLMDYKEGTEFNVYQKLPHLKVLTVSSEIEFGLSVLEYINEEIVKRGNLFKSVGVSDFSEYKLSGKGTLPRFLVIMDEFQVLLNPLKRTSARIAGLIEDITRRGRSFGINLILSTQSLGDVDLSISTLGQIGVRIALAMPSHDCIRILSMDNDLPVSFSKAGQAVYNNSLGRKEANSPFQVAYIDKIKISHELNLFPAIPDKKYVENQFIFDGSNNIHFEDNLEFSELIRTNSVKINDVYSDIYIGEPFYLSLTHFSFRIRKQHASNLLIVGDDPKAAISVSFYTLYQLLLQSSKESQIFVIDLFGVDSGLQGGYDSLKELGPNIEITSKLKSAEEFIGLVKAELNKRFEEEGRKGRIILCLMNINSFRQLKRTDYSLSPFATDLLSIIKDGPEYGIHTIIQTLNKKSFEEIFEYNIYNEFENLVLLKGYNPSDFNSEKDEAVTKDFTAFVISPRCKYSADKIKIYRQ